jgi:L-seryl-tRNA(Ser) seleniumtransferase
MEGESGMSSRQEALSKLPSVDEVLKSLHGKDLLGRYPRKFVLNAIRDVINIRRMKILKGDTMDVSLEDLVRQISAKAMHLSSYSLRHVINATGIVVHTNLGRAVLPEKAIEHVVNIAGGYSNLEYDLDAGRRGKRYAHIKSLLREITGAEDGIAVNNNAAAVLICLNSVAKDREVIVSRGELVEIGGSFRIPDVMAFSGAVLREVGTTNKTHLYDYEKAISERTALILKVHKSNFKVIGFTEEVPVERLVALGRDRDIPVMYDLGSGCLIDLKPWGIHSELSVQEILRCRLDLVTFSGDKLLGGPQAGMILGKKDLIERIQKNPLARAVRIDKLTLAALEATLMEYIDMEKAREVIPTIRMLLEDLDVIKQRAKRIAFLLKRNIHNASIEVVSDSSQAGGGAIPGLDLPSYAVAIRPERMSVNDLEERLRRGEPPTIARIKEGLLLLDARTIDPHEIPLLTKVVKAALGEPGTSS